MQVLDKLVVYLRVVHMVDYYNGTEFPNEDEMPNKIGVFHIRGPLETTSSKNSLQDGMCQSSVQNILGMRGCYVYYWNSGVYSFLCCNVCGLKGQ